MKYLKLYESFTEDFIYHGSGKGQVLNIQKDGLMNPSKTGEKAPSISFSDSINYAKYYAKMKGGLNNGVILRTKFDNNFELSKRFKNNKGFEYI